MISAYFARIRARNRVLVRAAILLWALLVLLPAPLPALLSVFWFVPSPLILPSPVTLLLSAPVPLFVILPLA